MAARTMSAAADGALASAGATWNGGTVLATGDTVTFDGTSVHTVTWDTATSVAGVTITAAYSGTVTVTTSLVCTGNFSIAAGTWDNNGAHAFTLNSGAGTLTVTGGTFKGGTSANSTGAVTFNGTGAIIATTNTWALAGSWTQSGATTTFTNSAGTINITAAATITDARSSFSKFTINAAGVVAIAASTTCPLGANPTTSTGTVNNFNNSGTITYSGTWSHTGNISANNGSTTTGTGSPAITLANSGTLIIGTTATWTSVNVTVSGTGGSASYSDTAAKNTGIWTLNPSGGYSVSASTNMNVGATPSLSINAGGNTLVVAGTLTWTGTMTCNGAISVSAGGTLTGSSSPSLIMKNSLTMNATSVLTNSLPSITFSGGSGTLTDTADKLSATTFTLSLTGGATFVVAASTICRLGAAPSTTTGGSAGNFSVTGTMSWSGAWTHVSAITVNGGGTLTGTSTPTLALTGGLNVSATGVITNTIGTITLNGTGVSQTYTDTGDLLSASTLVISQGAASTVTIAASTTGRLGSAPTSTCGVTGSITITGTLTYSGVWTHTGSVVTSASSTVTGTSSPALVLAQSGSLSISATSTGWTSVNVTVNGTGGTAGYTDTGAKNSGIWTFNSTSSFTVNPSTTMAAGASPTWAFGSNGAGMAVNGSLTFSGTFNWSGSLTVGATGTVTATSTPIFRISGSTLTLTSGATWNATMPITFNGAGAGQTLTATANTLGTVTVNQTGASAFTIAASTTCPLGASPTTTCGTGTLTNNGTITYSGAWSHTGPLTIATGSTTTGTSSPSLAIVNSLTISATASSWTSVNISLTGANGCTYTDTAIKNTGIWTVNMSGGGMTIAANTTADLGASPSWTTASASIVVTGTIKWSGTMTANSTFTINGTATATSTPLLTCLGSLTVGGSATITNSIPTVTFANNSGTSTLTDTGDKLSATTYVISSVNQAFTVAASTTCRIGAAPTTTCGTGTLTVTGTLTYSGVWTHTGSVTTSASSTVTGTGSPRIVINQSLTLNATSTWTSVNVTANGTTSTTYTDTGAKNSGTWTVSKPSGAAFVVAASTAAALGSNPSTVTAGGAFDIFGTVTYSGAWAHDGVFTTESGSTVTGTSSPSLSVTRSITLNATSTWTSVNISAIGTISTTYTDTGAKNSGTWTINKGTGGGFTIAASTSAAVGSNPTTAVGTGGSVISVSGTLTYSGAWAHTGGITVNAGGTVTGSSSPSLSITNDLNISATAAGWTSVNVTANGTALSTTYTDTAGKNTGTWTISKVTSGGVTVAASSTMALGATPTTSTGTSSFTAVGTVSWSGTWTHTGSFVTSNGSTVTGTSTPKIVLNQSVQIGATTTITNPISTITMGGTVTSTIADTGDALSGTTYVLGDGSSKTITVNASTICRLGANPITRLGTAAGAIGVTGTLTYSGLWTVTGGIVANAGGTVTGSSSPSIAVTGVVNISATAASWTSVNILSNGTTTTTYTDTGAKNSGTWTITKAPGSFTVAANTICNIGTNPTTFCTLTDGSNLITVFGTLTFAGNWSHSGLLTIGSGSTLTGTGSPTLSISDNLSFSGAATLTNPIPTITITEGPSTFALDDAGDKLSGSTYRTNKTAGTGVGIQVSTAGTVMRLGANPNINCGTATFIVSAGASVQASGTWTLTGALSVAAGATVSGALTALTIGGNMTVTSGATFPSGVSCAFVSAFIVTSQTIDAPGVTFGVCTINRNGVWVNNLGTTIPLGANPTIDVGGDLNSAVFNGPATMSGVCTINGSYVVGATGSVTGALTDVNATNGGFQLVSGAVFPNGVNVSINLLTSTNHAFNVSSGRTFGTFKRIGTGTGTTAVQGSSTFGTFQDNAGTSAHTLQFQAGTTQSVNIWLLGGSSGKTLTFQTSSSGSPATLHSTGGQADIVMDFMSFKDITVDVSPTWHAGTHTIDVSGNTNILFREDIPLDANIRASLGLRTVRAIKDHPSGIVVLNDVVYAQDDIIIYVPNAGDPNRAYEYPFDELHFPDYFVDVTPAGPVVVNPAILTFETFDAPRRAQVGARQVTAIKASPVGLFAVSDVLYAQHKFAIYIPKPGDATQACRFDFDGGLFDDYFKDV